MQILQKVEERAWVTSQSMLAVATPGALQAKFAGLSLAETKSCARAVARSPTEYAAQCNECLVFWKHLEAGLEARQRPGAAAYKPVHV